MTGADFPQITETRTMRVHNDVEAMALIRESVNPEEFNGTTWVTHDGVTLYLTRVKGVFTSPIVLKVRNGGAA